MIDEIGEDCSICLKYKKAPLKQVVGLSLSKHFNVISMDLKEINGHKILHMVDHAKRFSSAAVIKSKHKEETVKAIFQHWIVLFGPPNKLLSYDGGQFNNELLREMSDQLDIFVMSTPGEFPWSSGITERHNTILGNMISKLLLD